MRSGVAGLLFASQCARAAYDPANQETMHELSIARGVVTNRVQELVYHESFMGQHNCHVTERVPQSARGTGRLKFCHKFTTAACCAPAMDAENIEMFGHLTDEEVLGAACLHRDDIREDAIGKLYCLNCDPEQPRYVRPIPFRDVTGLGSPTNGRDAMVLISRTWAEDGFGADPVLVGKSGRLRDCGVKRSVPCVGTNGEQIPDRDRYTCGDDLVFGPDYIVKVNGVIDVVLSIEAFINRDSIGTPNIDDGYGFKLVDPRTCTEAELIAAYRDVRSDAAQQPRCLRSADQLSKTKYTFINNGTGVTTTSSTFRDFYCKNGFGLNIPEPGMIAHFVADNCTAVRPNGEDPGAAGDLCHNATVRKQHACCCGVWLAEQAFASAARGAPLRWLLGGLAMLATIAAAV